MANIPQQSTESQDAQFIIELVGRNDPDVNTNILIDKFTQKYGETDTNNLITHLFSIGLISGGHRGMIHMPPTEENKNYRDIQRINRFMKPIQDQIRQYRGTGNPIPEKLRKRYTRVYNRFIAPFEERRAINDMQKYFASRPDMSMEERQMRMMKMRQELAEKRRRATSDEYFDFISRPRPDFISSGIEGVAPVPKNMDMTTAIQKEANRRNIQMRQRLQDLVSKSYKTSLTDDESLELDTLKSNLSKMTFPSDDRVYTPEQLATLGLSVPSIPKGMTQQAVDAPKPPTQTITDVDERRKKTTEALEPFSLKEAFRRKERKPPRRTVDPKPPRRRRTKQTTDTKRGMGNRTQFTATGYYGPADRFYTYGTGPSPNFTKDNFTKQQTKAKGTMNIPPIKETPKSKIGLGSMQGSV